MNPPCDTRKSLLGFALIPKGPRILLCSKILLIVDTIRKDELERDVLILGSIFITCLPCRSIFYYIYNYDTFMNSEQNE